MRYCSQCSTWTPHPWALNCCSGDIYFSVLRRSNSNLSVQACCKRATYIRGNSSPVQHPPADCSESQEPSRTQKAQLQRHPQAEPGKGTLLLGRSALWALQAALPAPVQLLNRWTYSVVAATVSSTTLHPATQTWWSTQAPQTSRNIHLTDRVLTDLCKRKIRQVWK